MAEITDHALLLRAIPYSDSSLILHLLSENHGRLSLMARGARRAKSQLRAAISPMHRLNLSWRPPRTGSMGTLIDIQRLDLLLAEHLLLAGQQLLADASKLFPDGSTHGYHELCEAMALLSCRPEKSGLCVATWKMLELSGWVGDLEHCWHCDAHVPIEQTMFWRKGHLLCQLCAANHGVLLTPGFRKSCAAHLLKPYITLSKNDINLWNGMIQDMIKTHIVHQG